MDNILDHVVVQGQRYDIVSPTAFGDYIETIGSACINPDGYAQGSTFLAKFGNEQFYYEATAAITQGSAISEGTNCKRTTVTGREAELALEIENLGETVDSLNEALTNVDNVTSVNGAYNLLENTMVAEEYVNGVTFTVNNGIVTLSGTSQATIYKRVKEWRVAFPSSLRTGEVYKLVGCPTNTSNVKLVLQENNVDIARNNSENGVTFTQQTYDNTKSSFVYIEIPSGKNVDGIVIKPMITNDLHATYDDYVPYAMTNRELTEETQYLEEMTGGTSGVYPYRYLSGTYTTIESIPNGFWIVPGATTSNLTDIPSEILGRLYVRKATASDEYFIEVIVPYKKTIYYKFVYGPTSGWYKITPSIVS